MFDIAEMQDAMMSSLLQIAADVTDDMVAAAFGEEAADREAGPDEKYGMPWVIDGPRGTRYTIYKSFGVWRVGGWDNVTSPDPNSLIDYLMTFA